MSTIGRGLREEKRVRISLLVIKVDRDDAQVTRPSRRGAFINLIFSRYWGIKSDSEIMEL